MRWILIINDSLVSCLHFSLTNLLLDYLMLFTWPDDTFQSCAHTSNHNISILQENTIVAEESTGDEVEDKRLNRRTHAMLTTLQRHFDKGADVSLLDMIRRNHNRKQAAAKFYTCLVLQKHNMVSVEQSEPFADIIMSRGSNFAARAAA